MKNGFKINYCEHRAKFSKWRKFKENFSDSLENVVEFPKLVKNRATFKKKECKNRVNLFKIKKKFLKLT